MKTRFGILFVLSVALTSMQSYAKSQPITVKCYVEVMGGGETVYSVTYENDKITPEMVGKSIIGDKIYFKNHKKKATIYKAKECVHQDNEFISDVANQLEEELPQ